MHESLEKVTSVYFKRIPLKLFADETVYGFYLKLLNLFQLRAPFLIMHPFIELLIDILCINDLYL